MSVREILNDFSVNLVAGANLDLVKIAETVKSGQANLSCALNLNTVASCNAVEPAHTTGTACCCAVFAGIAAVITHFIGFLAENLADKFACADCRGISLCNRDYILDFMCRNTCAYSAVACES